MLRISSRTNRKADTLTVPSLRSGPARRVKKLRLRLNIGRKTLRILFKSKSMYFLDKIGIEKNIATFLWRSQA